MKKKTSIWAGVAILLAAAATAALLLTRRKDDDDKPPKRAPQLPINNPGEQSDFTTSASESEVG